MKYDIFLGRIREKDESEGSGGISIPSNFNTFEEYVSWLVSNNFPLPDQFTTWQEFIDWLTTNNFNIPDGFDTFEEYINFLINQSFPLPDQFATWQEFIDWLTTNNFLPPVGFNTWEEYLTWLINNTIPIPDQFNTWQEFIDWLTTNNFVIPDGFDTFEEYINFLINQSFPLPDQFTTWQEFIDWLTNNNFNIPDGFNSIEEYIDWYINQKFPLPDQFTTWQQFIDWLTANTYPDNYNSWEEYISSIVNQNNGSDSGTFLISGTITWVEGLVFMATDLVYQILGKKYTAQGREIELQPSDPALPRIDVFIADKFGNIFAVDGSPAADPLKPTVAFDQLEVTHVNISAGAIAPNDISTQIIYDENDSEEWTSESNSDMDITIDLDATDNPDWGLQHIKITGDIPQESGNSGTRYIGERYQGGVIFYIEPGGDRGLIAALTDQSSGEKYESLKDLSPYTTGATGLIIGTGKNNSDLLQDHLHNAALYAIKHCVNYNGGGYTDWYLPSRDELTAMYFRKGVIGGFAPTDYWSSSEINWKEAYSVRFSDGYVTDRDKDHRFRIRAIRAFDDTIQNYDIPVTEYTPEPTNIEFTAPEVVNTESAILVFQMAAVTPFLNNSAILIESWNDTEKVGGVMLRAVNSYGFNNSNRFYQQIAIPMSDFGQKSPEITKLIFRLVNSWPGEFSLYLDRIRFQIAPEQQHPEDLYIKSLDLDSTAKLTAKRSGGMPDLSVQFGTMALKKFWTGTQAAYDAIPVKDANTIYFTEV